MKTKAISHRISQQHGFTLIELIIVVVLLGILGAMGAGFISEAFRGFFDADVRMEMYEEGKSAMVRMEREIHIAVPNGVQVNGDGIELGVVDENAMAGVFGQYTEAHPSDTTITDRTAGLPLNTLVSIYNTEWAIFNNGSRTYSVTSNGTNPMTLDRNIGAVSPYQRFYAVRPDAVRFSVAGTTLSRSTATVNAGALLGAFGNPQTLAQNIVPSNGLPYFTYNQGTSTRNSVVAIHFAIARNGETVNFHKEVQIRNVP
ncbi:MAG: type II secretion system GspH family protein [Proteobacteria bacterium]|nr:type II secretion system GspH family protein [Pseudomonadota bacterium]MCG2823775.1 type II secretion system GspH family protein [Desulfobulbaceae bacterium]